jgi:hypothetical protein
MVHIGHWVPRIDWIGPAILMSRKASGTAGGTALR